MGKKLFPGPVHDLVVYWLPPFLWAWAILALSGDLGSSRNTLGLIRWCLSLFPWLSLACIEAINFWLRKAGHTAAYGALYFFWFRAFQGQLYCRPRWALLWSLGLCLLLALLDEGHQAMVGSRSGSLEDVALDLAGAGVVALLNLAVWTPRPPVRPASP